MQQLEVGDTDDDPPTRVGESATTGDAVFVGGRALALGINSLIQLTRKRFCTQRSPGC